MAKSKFAHFTLEDRTLLCNLLNENDKSFRKMSKILRCSPSTISNEILKYREYQDHSFGSSKRKCFSTRLSKAPYVCNGCPNLSGCKKSKYFYNPNVAHQKYRETLSLSRSKIQASAESLQYINDLISPLILEKGQTIDHVLLSNEVGVSRSTLYRYIDAGYFDVKNIDLKRRVAYKLNRNKKNMAERQRISKKGRKYLDFLVYCKAHPKDHIAELDTVIGKRDEEKCLLTILLRKSNFMIAFLLESKTASQVVEKLDTLESKWGKARFKTNLNICLTDNGSEFEYVNQMEASDRSISRCKVFYCDPRASQQKGKLEKNHEYIRYYFKKGTSFNELNQEKVNLMISHINSIKRKSLNNKSPFEMLTTGERNDMKKLGLNPISPDDVICSSKLFK